MINFSLTTLSCIYYVFWFFRCKEQIVSTIILNLFFFVLLWPDFYIFYLLSHCFKFEFGRHESKHIEEIVRDISNKLVGSSSSYMKGLVGMGPRIEAMNSLLCIGSIDVQMVGIWGMAGIGKTTIIRAVYERIHTQF